MSCKSAIYTVNNTLSTIAAAGTIPLGTTIRRFGCNLQLSGTGITVEGSGYYSVNASFTVTPSVAGTVTITLLKDGVVVPGASAAATTSAAAESVNLAIDSIIRLQCCDSTSTLTFVLSGGESTLNNAAVVVEKL